MLPSSFESRARADLCSKEVSESARKLRLKEVFRLPLYNSKNLSLTDSAMGCAYNLSL